MRSILIVASLIAVCFITGCQDISKAVMKKAYENPEKIIANWHVRKGDTYHLCDKCLKKINFQDTLKTTRVDVHYQHGLEELAKCLADQVESTMDHIEQHTSLSIPLKPELYLIRVDEIPQVVDMRLPFDPNSLPYPVFVKAGEESCDALTNSSWIYPNTFFHELTECSLIAPGKTDGLAWGDGSGKIFGIINYKVKLNTRWFREGFAEYCKMLACEKLATPAIYQEKTSALLALSKRGTAIFKWDQSSNNKRSYYNASLGLFLLIRHEFGDDAISRIVAGLGDLEYKDGESIIKHINKTLKTDFVQLVDDFKLPKLSMGVRAMTPAESLNRNYPKANGILITTIIKDGPADKAGLKKDDIICNINDRQLKTADDFALAILEASEAGQAEIKVWRMSESDDTGKEIDIQLMLKNPDDD